MNLINSSKRVFEYNSSNRSGKKTQVFLRNGAQRSNQSSLTLSVSLLQLQGTCLRMRKKKRLRSRRVSPIERPAETPRGQTRNPKCLSTLCLRTARLKRQRRSLKQGWRLHLVSKRHKEEEAITLFYFSMSKYSIESILKWLIFYKGINTLRTI
jgi:hypothetical protein